MNQMESSIPSLYRNRFSSTVNFRQNMWEVLTQSFFQKFIAKDSNVVEVACGYCEFINNIQAKRKIGVDLNPDAKKHAHKDVEIITGKSTELAQLLPEESVDYMFSSNFFEHISREDIIETFRQAHKSLKKGGKYLILQPNIRFCQNDYWQFFDHITPIDDRALCEVLNSLGFEIELNIARFLPYTTQGKLPNSLFLLKIYLKMPFVWPLFGQQSFIIAKKM